MGINRVLALYHSTDPTTHQPAEGESEDMKEGLDTFFSASVAIQEAARTPVSSPISASPSQVDTAGLQDVP